MNNSNSLEIEDLVKRLSLNIIKTREILKETFDEYISTLISFDRIKDKIQFLKVKNDESYNDCSPVFSRKFQLISNMQNEIFDLETNSYKFQNLNNQNLKNSQENLKSSTIEEKNKTTKNSEENFSSKKNFVLLNTKNNCDKIQKKLCKRGNISQECYAESDIENNNKFDVNSLYYNTNYDAEEQDQYNYEDGEMRNYKDISDLEKSEENFQKNFKFYKFFKNNNTENYPNYRREDNLRDNSNTDYNNYSLSRDNKINNYGENPNNLTNGNLTILSNIPQRKKEKILNTGNKIRKMNYFENHANNSNISNLNYLQNNNSNFAENKILNNSENFQNLNNNHNTKPPVNNLNRSNIPHSLRNIETENYYYDNNKNVSEKNSSKISMKNNENNSTNDKKKEINFTKNTNQNLFNDGNYRRQKNKSCIIENNSSFLNNIFNAQQTNENQNAQIENYNIPFNNHSPYRNIYKNNESEDSNKYYSCIGASEQNTKTLSGDFSGKKLDYSKNTKSNARNIDKILEKIPNMQIFPNNSRNSFKNKETVYLENKENFSNNLITN